MEQIGKLLNWLKDFYRNPFHRELVQDYHMHVFAVQVHRHMLQNNLKTLPIQRRHRQLEWR